MFDLQVMDIATCQRLPYYGPERDQQPRELRRPQGPVHLPRRQRRPAHADERTPKLVGIISWGKARCNGDGQSRRVYERVA